jgi:hypothetical protein
MELDERTAIRNRATIFLQFHFCCGSITPENRIIRVQSDGLRKEVDCKVIILF